ncbi:matrix metalloproteinase-2-like [Tribolium castaneum]|uniref:matrix metalloproteinase-2-like n=1 Tax=Tribolium castaneum TaxID=7070 RepID=UPI0030FE8A48
MTCPVDSGLMVVPMILLDRHIPINATNEMKELAQKAFDQWESVSNLKFEYWHSQPSAVGEYNSVKPDILISFSNTLFQHNHNSRCQKGICSSSFDGKGNVLAHGFFPNNDECLGIHFDKSENWYFGESSNTPDDQTNFCTVLLHEIGHTLGIEHSANNNSIMYAYYKGDIDKLTRDDMWAIQYLYGRPERLKYESIPTTTTTTTTSNTTKKPITLTPRKTDSLPDLCSLSETINTFLTANHKLYIFYKKYVWIVNLKDMSYDNKPKLITDYLTFLPDNFQEISQIYQRPDGTILLTTNNLYYIIDFPNFVVKNGYNGRSITSLGVPSGKKINAIFSTYSGQTYIFYDNTMFIQFDECLLRPKKHGMIAELFSSIPSNVDKAFRYINGKIYFFKDNNYYEYHEFLQTTKSYKFDLSIFGIKCSIIDKIMILLNKLK